MYSKPGCYLFQQQNPEEKLKNIYHYICKKKIFIQSRKKFRNIFDILSIHLTVLEKKILPSKEAAKKKFFQ